MRRQPQVTNARDEAQLRRAADVENVRERAAAGDLLTMLETPSARRVTWERLRPLYIKAPLGDPMVVGFALGRRYDAEWLRDRLWNASKTDNRVFEQWQLMEREAMLRERLEDGAQQALNTPTREGQADHDDD